MKGWLFLAIAIVSEVVGTSGLKASNGFSKLGPSLVSIVAYGASFYFLSLALRSVPISMAYAVWAGLGIALIAVVGWVAFGQKIDGWGALGISLILAGVLVMNLLSKSAAH
ncbi:multidrug efflux SMR transporter [uncultured Stenotrophomonas sp.]|jgi:multidrug transporter EmrE-like cation transporter|uniref:DMT family transporter n=1 Tax=uncultured Stenotrophomonas sp. TaxID=165438 RepID=UPI001AC8FBE1|nr:multidrug efflux SMR transporter [uncultured Stenotrophomonas sp.]MBN8261424.1 multidrug efflux SMR transporter [Xanthomonadales bacterium]